MRAAPGMVLAATFCVAAGVVGCSDPAPPSGNLVLLSYNVAGLPQEISQANPEAHIPLISPLLDDYDLVLTQEDFDWWRPLLDSLDFVHYHERLRADTSHQYSTAPYPGPEATGVDLASRPALQVGDGLGVLSRYPLNEEVRVPWTGCFGSFDVSDGGAADCLAAKGFTRVTIALHAGDDPANPDPDDDTYLVDVYTLHAEAGSTLQDQQLQEADFAQLADYINQNSADRPVIVGGDTNLHTHSGHPDGFGDADTTVWEGFLGRTGLTDACAAVRCRETDAIDKVAYRSGGGIHLEATVHSFPRSRFTDPDGAPLSDHPPLAVALHWEAEE